MPALWGAAAEVPGCAIGGSEASVPRTEPERCFDPGFAWYVSSARAVPGASVSNRTVTTSTHNDRVAVVAVLGRSRELASMTSSRTVGFHQEPSSDHPVLVLPICRLLDRSCVFLVGKLSVPVSNHPKTGVRRSEGTRPPAGSVPAAVSERLALVIARAPAG